MYLCEASFVTHTELRVLRTFRNITHKIIWI